MTQFVAFAFCLCLSSVSASWFRSDPPVATSDGRAIDQSCLALADQGSCDFYSCFERRLPCGRDWYILKTGLYYCNKIERQKVSFSPEGQQFLSNAQRCLTQSLKDMYQRDYVDCHDLEHDAVANITRCFTGFCDVFESDSEHFLEIYEIRDLFSRGAGKVWRQIVLLATRCGGDALREFTSNARQSAIQFYQLPD
ncbi:unnamed protein product [Candidula unifasciata]|uniref:Stanniocalcin n=1 Tax=Candidula unifasciata TaxID=100452 RepID=A0A8S4A3K7_9EUPU|nr:unnamed protein product [Candidula unifasciata]